MSGLTIKTSPRNSAPSAAVNNVELNVPHGTFVCLLGPSGCGKTTLLRMIAGLEVPTGGAILLDGEDITRVPTHKRNLGMVFQSLALFPHLSVGENIAYPLRIRGASKEEQKKRVDELLALIHLPGYADRPVAKLSGGQRQRVAIARALGALAQTVPARRAAFGARRQAARGDAGGTAPIAAAARHHHHRRHP